MKNLFNTIKRSLFLVALVLCITTPASATIVITGAIPPLATTQAKFETNHNLHNS